ncbi:MAG TPA: endo-1,4-beta-xylanase [Luteibacter sp.]|uniref:endo-1,4-beta-xylanase n=1 Tax=Luteibacter sp. TaxID=1886636 RepID=UPI002BF034E4|nr:endo-1,4-beta-xylanase [Luteibacter sp.]HVI56270.1 endo-1,4-beta-xylanase [Luteibacter sp.]
MLQLSRRRFVTGSLRALACAPFLRVARAAETFKPLRQLSAIRGVAFGFAVNPAELDDNPLYRDFVAREANVLVPENALKWASVQPRPGIYDFAPSDRIAAFAQAHGQHMRGHTFCWHRALPDWVSQTVVPTNAEGVLTNHIATVAGHYRGRIQSWDVVNEAIQVEDGQPGGLRTGFWYRMLGPRYLDIAFHAAHQADPKAILCYNDYGLEGDTPYGQRKRAAVLAMLGDLRRRGVPVQALGIQSHLRAGDANSFGPGLADFLRDVRNLGLSVYVTELDVDDSHLEGDTAQRDAMVATVYKRYLDLVLGTQSVSAILTWGVWDTPHRTGATPSGGPLAQRALAFGPEGETKAASWVIEHALERMRGA